MTAAAADSLLEMEIVHGRQPESGTGSATYRVGNGRAGNIGADSRSHIALALPEITLVRNPLSVDLAGSESLRDVRQRAPVKPIGYGACRDRADYAEVTERRADVQRAPPRFAGRAAGIRSS